MAEWEHKERNWSDSAYNELYGEEMTVNDNQHGRIRRSFTEWLDWQCTDGWEVFKISRIFNNHNNTWCVFRRLV